MVQQSQVLLGEAFTNYLEAQADKDRQAVQQELARFIRWRGRERATGSLTPLDVEEYCGTLDDTGEASSQRLAITKKFLVYLHRQGWTNTNLAPHAKLRRSGRKSPASQRRRQLVASSQLTAEGHQRLQDELDSLKSERVGMVEDIRLAAATKDFSENAPLDAAREHQGQVEARIRELEGILKGATILKETTAGKSALARVDVGSRIVLRHVQTGQEVSYLLVESSEADPTEGKLSAASPVGKAVLTRAVGDEVEVATPRGAVRYVVKKIGN